QRAHAADHTICGTGRGIAAGTSLTGYACDVLCLRANLGHVLRSRPDILSSDVAPAQALDKATKGVEACGAQRRIALLFAIRQDDGLGATQWEPRDGGLVGHPLGEAQHVQQRLRAGIVAPETCPAETR